MGTRHSTMVISKKEVKIAQYGQWDGHCESAGVNILKFLRGANLKEFKNKVDKLKEYKESEVKKIWKDTGADDSGWVGLDVSKKVSGSNPELSRDTGSDILTFILKGKVTKVQLDKN